MSLPTLFVLGDSISMHYGPHLASLGADTFIYSRKTGKEGCADPRNPEPANGGDSAMVLRFLQCLHEHNLLSYDYVLLNCGLHDIKTVNNTLQVPADEYRQNLTASLDLLLAHNCRVIWVRTTPVFDQVHNSKNRVFLRHAFDVEQYNSIADALMHERGVPILDLYGFTLPFLPGAYTDHVHFTEDLRKKQAAFLYKELKAILNPNP